MRSSTYENVMFFMTIANIVLGLTSVTLGTLAILVLRDKSKIQRAPSKELVPWDQRPQATLVQPRIQPSVLAETRRRFQDGLWD